MGKLFEQVIGPVALRAAADKVIGNRGGPGGDGMTVGQLERLAPVLLARLHGELAARSYRPGPLRRAEIPKRSGGTRQLAIPCVIDRVAQTAVATGLSLLLDPGFSPDSFAYRPGRGVKQAVARVSALRRAGYDHVVDGDIRGFFDAVPHAPLLARLAAEVADPALLDLIGQWLAGWDQPADPGRGLAQGSPLSPVLANLHLDALDDLFAEGPVRIVRFADDFILLTKGARQAERALAQAREFLAAHGLELHPEKTRIVPFEQRFDFLGHLFIRSVVLEAEQDQLGEQWQAERAARSRASSGANEGLPFIPGPALSDWPGAGDAEVSSGDLPPEGPRTIALNQTCDSNDDGELLDDLAEGRRIDDFAIGLAPLYLIDGDARLTAYGECFEVQRGGRVCLRVPAAEVGRIEVAQGARADDLAIRLAADYGLTLSLLDGRGRAQAMLVPPQDDRGGLHLAQARQSLDPAAALAQARDLVEAKLRNQHALLKRLNRRRKRSDVAETCTMLRRLCHVEVLRTIDDLRGREGDATDRYWRALGKCLEHGFGLGNRRSAPDNPVVAVLDWLSHLLTRDVAAAVVRAGLHPGFGTLHASGDRREALAYDLIEPFRAPLADGLAVYLFNNRIVRSADFVDGGAGLRLSGGAARQVLSAYENWIARPIRNPRDGRMTSWRMLLLDQAQAYAAALRQGDSSNAFVPYRMDW